MGTRKRSVAARGRLKRRPPRRARRNPTRRGAPCDPRCIAACGPQCECRCHARNHGTGGRCAPRKRRKNPGAPVAARARQLLERAADAGLIDEAELLLEALLTETEGAAKEYKKLHWGRDPKKLVASDAPAVEPGEVLTELGVLHEVAYQAVKDDEDAIWVHPFESPRPRLAVNKHGRLILVGGGYTVKEAGIIG